MVGGAPVNRDAVHFSSLAGFLRDEAAVPVPPADNVYVRFAAYPLLGSVLAPLVGSYVGFVAINVLFWAGASVATYALALSRLRSSIGALLAAVLVASAPAFAALAGQPLPYVTSYSLFALGLWLFDHVRLFERNTSSRVALAGGVLAGLSFLVYDLYMLPAFVVVYGLLRRMPLTNLAVVLIAMLLPRLAWSGYWQLAQLPSYSHNESHPAEALAAWLQLLGSGSVLGIARQTAALAIHGVLNVGAAFLFWPIALAAYELWHQRRSSQLAWYISVLVAGFVPAAFMLSTWPHIPRWYAYGFPAVYILAAGAALRIAASLSPRRSTQTVLAVALVAPALVLANLDVVGYTKPMELLLFQPADWSYLWSP